MEPENIIENPEHDPDLTLVEQMCRRMLKDRKATVRERFRASELLGRLRQKSWFSKPADAKPMFQPIDNSTAQILAQLADENFALLSRETVKTILECIEQHQECPAEAVERLRQALEAHVLSV
jgi:hypothetical protein